MGSRRIVEEVASAFPGRESQIETLVSLLDGGLVSPPPLFVYGQGATGKTSVVQAVVRAMVPREADAAYVDVSQCCNAKTLFSQILNQLYDHRPCASNKYTNAVARCNQASDFVWRLETLLAADAAEGHHRRFLVVDKAERLLRQGPTLLPLFLRLPELVDPRGNGSFSLACVFISDVIWDKLRFHTGMREPIPVFFPEYRKSEMLTIMDRHAPQDRDAALWHAFADLMHDIFLHSCRDLSELLYLMRLLFPVYCLPIDSGECTADDKSTLYARVQPYIKKVIDRINLRDLCEDDLLDDPAFSGTAATTTTASTTTATSSAETTTAADAAKSTLPNVQPSRIEYDLPYHAKYMLIASYLGSYNPASKDVRVFTRYTRHLGHRKKSSAKGRHKRQEVPQALLGPRKVPLERLLAIFHAIVDDPTVIDSADLMNQIGTLVSLGLVVKSSSPTNIGRASYKCGVTSGFILALSKNVGCPIERFLWVD